MTTTWQSRNLTALLPYLVHIAVALLLACVGLSILPDFRAGLEPGLPLPVLTSIALWHGGALSVLPVGATCSLSLLDVLGLRVVRDHRDWGYGFLYATGVGTALILLIGVAAPYCALSFPEAESSGDVGPSLPTSPAAQEVYHDHYLEWPHPRLLGGHTRCAAHVIFFQALPCATCCSSLSSAGNPARRGGGATETAV